MAKFNLYCLINADKREEAQLQFDLKKEMGFEDDFFERTFFYLMGYEDNIEKEISEDHELDMLRSFNIADEFKFIPNEFTSKNIWRYLSTSNLLEGLENVDLEDLNKISIIEKATHERNYIEKELYDLYKRFQFNINQLLSVKQSYKLLSNVEARALVYQGILITSEIESKMELIKILKDLYIKENIENAFKDELAKILQEIDIYTIPSNYTDFYIKFADKMEEETSLTKIKINNKIIHQSKLLNYFKEDPEKKNITKDLNDLLKKIKKDKNYYISTKDIILIESLKSDGVQVEKKYEDLYQLDNFIMPEDIQFLIDNNDIGLVLLRLVEVIGQDEIESIGPETLYFIISALNQLNIDHLRNRILFKVLPLKVQKYN